MKRLLARCALRLLLPRFARDASPFQRLLGRAVLLQEGRLDDEAFRRELDAYFAGLDPEELRAAIDFPAKARRLRQPGGYKVPILDYGSANGGGLLWRRRFGLLGHLGIRSDVLVLHAGQQIPPHGHNGVVSGFYVIEGEVAVRHYDRIRETPGGLLVKLAVDRFEGPGDYTTNSEFHHNIHWLAGGAKESFLFRLTVLGTPTPRFGARTQTSDRLYLDPTGEPDADGLIDAPYVSEAEAKRLVLVAQHVPSV